MRVVGLDPAFANFGMVVVSLTPTKLGQWGVVVQDMQLLQTEKLSGKKSSMRVSSDVLRRAQELHKGLHNFLEVYKPEMVFAEVPSGAQSAAAGQALGVAVGVLGSIRVPLIEVTPLEVKRLFTQRKEAVPKARIIDWAYDRWPQAPWLEHHGKRTLNNEHLADALATIQAGIATSTFQQLLAMRGLNEVPMPDHDRHPSGGQPERRVPMGTVSVDKPADQKVRRKVPSHPW